MKSNFYRVVITTVSFFCVTTLVAQESDQNEDTTVLEEVTVVGSQIRGAKISGALSGRTGLPSLRSKGAHSG